LASLENCGNTAAAGLLNFALLIVARLRGDQMAHPTAEKHESRIDAGFIVKTQPLDLWDKFMPQENGSAKASPPGTILSLGLIEVLAGRFFAHIRFGFQQGGKRE
jgi:hypothetical protein